jgi:hypothetical protein
MIWNSLSDEERLCLWKKLRADIKDLTLDEKLKEIAKFTAGIPFGSRTLDYYDTQDWPTPWEILYHGSFCKSSISLLIYYTLSLLDADVEVELELIEDGGDLYLVPVVQDTFLLNYHLGEVVYYSDVAQEFDTKKVFKQEQIKKIL